MMKNTEVVIYVSKGPENIVAKNAYCKWISIGKSKEKWGFTLPYVNKGVLYIDCNDVVLSESIKWKKSSEEGVGIAEVSLTEDFEQTTLAKIKYEKEESAPFEPMHIILAVPIEELKEEKPSALYFKLATEKNGESEDIRVDFTLTW